MGIIKSIIMFQLKCLRQFHQNTSKILLFNYKNALIIACENNHVEIVRLLINKDSINVNYIEEIV